jgi:hypothetical protein
MTDIPEMYLAEAVRRANARAVTSDVWTLESARISAAMQAFARALQELGWTPPIDEARMAKARKVAAAVLVAAEMDASAGCVLAGTEVIGGVADAAIQAAYDALGED